MKQLNDSHPAMSCIGNFTSEDFTGIMKNMGFPAYRGKQVFHALYARNHESSFSFDAISTLPKDVRNTLKQKFGEDHHSLTVKDVHVSQD